MKTKGVTCEITSDDDQRRVDHGESRGHEFVEVGCSVRMVDTEMEIRKLNHPH